MFTTMNSMIETTTNTFNQDSQDTGYQTTTSANCGANGSSSSGSASGNCTQSSTNPSLIMMDSGVNKNNIFDFKPAQGLFTLNLNPSRAAGSSSNVLSSTAVACINGEKYTSTTIAATITSTPMSLGDEEFNFNYDNVANANFESNNYLDCDEDSNEAGMRYYVFAGSGEEKLEENCGDGDRLGYNFFNAKNPISFDNRARGGDKSATVGAASTLLLNKMLKSGEERFSSSSNKRPLNLDVGKAGNSTESNANKASGKSKKTSISLNSLQNIHPVGKLNMFFLYGLRNLF